MMVVFMNLIGGIKPCWTFIIVAHYGIIAVIDSPCVEDSHHLKLSQLWSILQFCGFIMLYLQADQLAGKGERPVKDRRHSTLKFSEDRRINRFEQPPFFGAVLVAGWWWLEHVLFFPYIGKFIIPIDFHTFQRGRYTTNQVGDQERSHSNRRYGQDLDQGRRLQKWREKRRGQAFSAASPDTWAFSRCFSWEKPRSTRRFRVAKPFQLGGRKNADSGRKPGETKNRFQPWYTIGPWWCYHHDDYD